MNEIGIGLIGFGTVGSGVVEALQKNGDIIAARLGVRPVIARIADIDLERDRGVKVARSLLTKNADDVLNDPSVKVVVELIGGTGAAKDIVQEALRLHKPVVTANKALLAEHGESIFKLAEEMGADIYFGASVGGGIPIIRALRDGFIANRIESIRGILNGTCNYILTRMRADRVSFDEALKAAQAAGYAESDPALDIDGTDTGHKAAILATLAYGFSVPMKQVHVEGIRGVSQADIEYADGLGYRIKLLAVIKRAGDAVDVRVHPALVPADHMLASVNGVFNAVMVRGDFAGDSLFYGRGAGREPTAGTVVADIADVARNLVAGAPRKVRVGTPSCGVSRIRDIGEAENKQYLRLAVLDRPGVFARISSVLGRHNISIAAVQQKESKAGECVPVIMVTHSAGEKAIAAAIAEIDRMDVVGAKTARLRIEE